MKNFGKTTDIKDVITVEYEADNAVLYSTSQSLTNNQKAQARTNIGAGTSSFDGNYSSLSNKPTIPTKTSQLNNDSNFATTSQVEAKYTKPAGGIPKTDLATAVQNSLTAADNAVKYTSQSLTDAQKAQARTNIGAGTSNFSGSYNDLTNRPTIPAAVSIVQSTGTSTSSVMSQKATTDAVNGRLSKTDNTNIEVLGTKKATTTLGGNQLYAPNGIIFGGTAASAGLLTRGISGIGVPTTGGACSKENLYINYDGNNDFNAGRQVVLSAGTVGNHLGSNMYQYTAPRGEIVKNWVEAKGYATTSQVDAKQDAITASNKLSASLVSGLATVATSGSYNDLANKPSIPDVSGKANLESGNTFSGNQQFNGGNYYFSTTPDSTQNFVVEDYFGNALVRVNADGFNFDDDGIGFPLIIDGSTGADGQVLTSQGPGKTPIWEDAPQPDISGKQDKLTAGANISISGNTISATDTGMVDVDVVGGGNAITGAAYSASTRLLTLTKGATYATTSQIPTKTSQLTNDSGYATTSDIPTFSLSGTTLTITL